MDSNSVEYLYSLFLALVLDIRFQLVFGFILFAHWAWRLPRPRKGAGNRAVFITGCDSGMGHRMARRFDEMGLHVFAGCLQPQSPGAESLRKVCSKRLHIVPIDITKEDQVKEAVAYVKGNLPTGEKGLYGLINNAGVMAYTYLDLLTSEMCEEVIAINMMGTIRVTKHFLPLIAQAQGRIVTITSIVARMPFPLTSVYAATKYALNGFFTSLRYELQDKGVQVAIVEPGDFSRTTDIMQWTRNHLEDMWKNLSPEEQNIKKPMFEQTKRYTAVAKSSPSEQETNYKYLLEDVEDALLAEEPNWRYVSAPLSLRIKLWIIRNLPEEISFKLISRRSVRSE
ncbi:11-beta-hydroxysteroid dehydrogenase type 2-like [Parasteatoda tepidariorum]|uniref:11-beta-hydroxysteroid dehydrogenase type 2-like n=1 Tax=Parasteatoda tepidariorum TaxID=114398 RepID=UPI00077F8EBF|nr:D-beta-hydroxybutyrate dehydrogenase, mitochondrial-like [Parasteatoda tepidariorum]